MNRAKARTQPNKSSGKLLPEHYRKPGATGGKVIRQVLALLRQHGVQLPIASHILIATSAGSDSLALAHLLTHYGRRVGDRSKITLLHINHGWRGAESDADAEFVRAAAKRWDVASHVVRLAPPKRREAQGWEDAARTERKKVYLREAAQQGAVVLTAHHADDLAETVLWRVLTGSHETHGGGIAVKHGVELRPLLAVRKAELKQYLREEGESWREDATNTDARFLRARIRMEIMPAIERVFPRAAERLVRLGLNAQLGGARQDPDMQELEALFSASGLRLRRSHWESIAYAACGTKPSEIHLPDGWRLSHDPKKSRWVLEKEPFTLSCLESAAADRSQKRLFKRKM